jgi:hypothetical protein
VRKRLAASVAVTVCWVSLGVAGCSGGSGGSGGGHATASAQPAVSCSPTHGHRKPVPYDFGGTGRADLVLPDTGATVQGVRDAGYAAVLPGGSQGPDPKHARLLTQNGIGEGPAGQGAYFGAATASADLDGDGKADLVVQAGYSTLFVLWSGGTADGKPARLHGAHPFTGDFDGDGHADLATTGSSPFTETIAYGPFDRSGKPARTATVRLPVDRPAGKADPFLDEQVVAVGDINGDGRSDLITSWATEYTDIAPTPRATVVWYGTATGVTRGPRLKDAKGQDVYGSSYGEPLAVGDFDGDGCDDIAVGLPNELGPQQEEPGPPKGGSRLTVWYGGAKRTPLTLTAATAGLPGALVADGFGGLPVAGDVNGDGAADLAFFAEPRKGAPSEVLVLRGGPHGVTTSAAQLLPGRDATAMTMLDTDGDGRADLVTGAPHDQPPSVTVLRGSAEGLDASHPLTIASDGLGTPLPPDGPGYGTGFGSAFGR